MAIKYGTTQIKQMVDAIDQDHESAEDAALAALAVAEELLEERAKFVVVGQLVGTSERASIPADDPEAIKVALAYYSTEGDAQKAAESLWKSTQTGDRYQCWVLPMFYGTPADLHTKQKEKYAAAEEKAKAKALAKLEEGMAKRQKAIEARAAGGKGSCETCAHQWYDHQSIGTSRGRCYVPDCSCEKWKERLK